MSRSKRFDGRSSRLIVTVVGLLSASAASAADGYAGVAGGVHFWPLYSNRDQVEADTSPGYSWSFALGIELGRDDLPEPSWLRTHLSPRLALRTEAEASQRFSGLHGVNDDNSQRTADGKKIQATSAHWNVWPTVRITRSWSLYIGGGVGASWIRTLGSDKVRLSLQAGTGLLVDLPFESVPLRIDIGWRSFFASSEEYRGRLVDYNTHGGVLGIQLKF